jgi:hypothetical protein
MEGTQPQQSEESTVDARPGRVGIFRELFDINSYSAGEGRGWRIWLVQVVLFGVGSGVGWLIWRIVDADSADDRSFFERILTNAYVWSCLIVTAVYALRDWLARRRNAKNA